MIFVVFFIFFLCCISEFLIFDRILRIQYKNHYSEWVRSGKPHGFFFKPKESYIIPGLMPEFGSLLAMQRLCFTFQWKTPKWAVNEAKVLQMLFWYRAISVLAILVWLVMVYLTIYVRR